MRSTPVFEIKPIARGRRITIYAVTRNGKSEVSDFLLALKSTRPGDYTGFIQNLHQVADAFPLVRESRLRKIKGEPCGDMWEVKRGQHRLYGFVAPGGLYLYRYDYKTKQKPSTAILKSVADCREEWREQYG